MMRLVLTFPDFARSPCSVVLNSTQCDLGRTEPKINASPAARVVLRPFLGVFANTLLCA